MKTVSQGKNLTASIVEDLGIAIVTGFYNQDIEFPTEGILCEKYDVSRGILREAVKILSAKGLLSSRPRQGTKVRLESHWNILDPDVLEWFLKRKLSISLLREFTQVRLSVEPAAAALAARNASKDDIVNLKQAVDRMAAAEYGDDDPLESDIAFHIAVLEASHNRFFNQLKSLAETALKFSIRFTNSKKGVRLVDVNSHRLAYEAIAAGNATLAEEVMRLMLQEVELILSQAEVSSEKKITSSYMVAPQT